MRLKPAIIMLGVFILVIGGLALFVSTYTAPTTDELLTLKENVLFPGLVAAKVVKLEILNPGTGTTPVVIERVGSNKWMITRPLRSLASNAKIREVLTHFAGLKAARGYATTEFANYDLAKPRYRVTVTTKGGDTHTVAFGTEVAEIAGDNGPEYVDFYTLELQGGGEQAVPRRYARVGDRPQVLIVQDALCREIDQPPAAFREAAVVFAETTDEIAPVEPTDCESVSISVREDAKVRTLRLTKVDDVWRLVSPIEARANGRRAVELLGLLCGLRADGPAAYVDDTPADLARYGLDKPKVTVEVGLGGERHTVRFGGSPEGEDGWMYVQSSSRSSVLLVEGGILATSLTQGAEFFRSGRVVEFAGHRVESMSFVYGSGRPSLTVARRPDDAAKWELAGATTGRAGAAAVVLLKMFAALAVEPGGYVSEDASSLAQYGLDKPRITVTTVLSGAPPVTLLIGDSPKDNPSVVYAKVASEPSIVLISGSVVDELSPDSSVLRSRELFEGFDRWGAFELEIVRGKDVTRLVRGENLKWRFVSPEGLGVDYAAPSNFCAQLAALAIAAWPADKPGDDAAFGLAEPRAVLTVKTRSTGAGQLAAVPDSQKPVKTYTLQFGARTQDGRRCYVRLPSEANVYEVDAAILDRVERGPLLFRNKTVLKLDERGVKSIRLEGGRANYAGQKVPGGRWLLTRPLLASANAIAIKNLLEGVRTINAVELVAEGDLANPKYGLTKPHRLLGLIIEEEPPKEKPKEGAEPAEPQKVLVSKTLVVGAPAPGEEKGGRYAAIREDKMVFVLAAEDVKKLDGELIAPTVVNILKGHVTKVSVVHRDGSQVGVARDGHRWTITTHKDVEPDVPKVERFVEEAGWILAEAFVRYDQKELAKYGLENPRLVLTISRKGKLPVTVRIGDAAVELPPMPRSRRGEGKPTYYHATGGGMLAVFLVTEEKVKALEKHVEDLTKKGKK